MKRRLVLLLFAATALLGAPGLMPAADAGATTPKAAPLCVGVPILDLGVCPRL